MVIALGVSLGAAGGALGVTRLEPARPGAANSPQLTTDSLRDLRSSRDPRAQRREADSIDAEQRAHRIADSTALANDPDAPVVPDVVHLEEGAARKSIELAGLTVGGVLFRADTTTAGTVIASTPAAGAKARAGSAVDLVLSDGRIPPPPPVDALAVPTVLHRQL